MTTIDETSLILPTFQHGRWHRSRDAVVLSDGAMLGLTPELSVVAELTIGPATPAEPIQPSALRVVLAEAASQFRHGTLTIDGRIDCPEIFAERMAAIQGLPHFIADDWCVKLEERTF